MRLQFRDLNQIDLLCRGAEYFPRLIESISQASREVLLETYIYADDATGRAVTEALCAAALRGVQVHLLIDGFGARNLAPDFRRRFADSGVRVLVFRPLKFVWSRHAPHLRRMHRKLAVVDGSVAFVGGINIIDDLNEVGNLPPRLDYAVQVRGPLVADVALSARRLWAYASRLWLKRPWDWPDPPPPPPAAGGMRAALAVRDNFRRRHLIQSAYLAAIHGAHEEILFAHAYFWPGRRMLRALCNAAARGVRVRILLQGQSDHPLLLYATRSLYERLLKAGIELYEYRKTHLHTKVAVIDGQWATVGSSNIDPFSLLLAREANVIVQDRGFCATLYASLEHQIADGGVRLTPGLPHSWVERLRIRASYAIVRLIASTVGFRA